MLIFSYAANYAKTQINFNSVFIIFCPQTCIYFAKPNVAPGYCK